MLSPARTYGGVHTHNRRTSEAYVTHRLVRTERIGCAVRQVTLLNLSRFKDTTSYPLAFAT